MSDSRAQMAPQEKIRDLDLLTGEPILVKLNGTVYKLPADVPIPVALKTEALAATFQDDGDEAERPQALTDLYDTLLELFRVHQPELESVPLSSVQALTFVRAVYGGGLDDIEQAQEERPTGSKRTASTTRKSRAKASSTSRRS